MCGKFVPIKIRVFSLRLIGTRPEYRRAQWKGRETILCGLKADSVETRIWCLAQAREG